MEKLRVIQLLAVAVVTCVFAGQAMAVPSIYNTGVDNGGVALSSGADDTHYALTAAGYTQAIAVDTHPAWVAAPAGSMWIGPAQSWVTVPVQSYDYTMTFEVATLVNTVVTLSGSWSTDNTGEIWLNGSDTGIARTIEMSYQTLEDFLITDGFVPGTNTLVYKTQNMAGGANGANPNGLLVANLLLTQTSNVPAPGAIMLVSLGTCAIGFVRRRGIL